VPAAWRIAFETAASRDVTAAQDMLLGINAHVHLKGNVAELKIAAEATRLGIPSYGR
jgi:Family of unknown function (DUF5995)